MSDHFPRQPVLPVIACALLSLLSCVGYAGAQNGNPAVVINVKLMPQDGPVRILGMRIPGMLVESLAGRVPLVHLRNFSSKMTSRVWVDAVIGSPQGRAVRSESALTEILWPKEHEIAPGAEVWSKETVLASSNLLELAKHLDSACIFVGVRVGMVQFVDGTRWFVTGESARYPWNAERVGNCSGATASEDEIGGLQGSRFPGTAPPKLQLPGEVQSFSFTCVLDSDYFGSCPY